MEPIKTIHNDGLSHFHPLIRDWFGRTIGPPTGIQTQAWPVIAAGHHCLVIAPTGSGKTLTAFLWGLDQLISRHWPSGQISLLYISPLKALNTDIRNNLSLPLQGIEGRFEESGQPFHPVRIMTRSGDTPRDERLEMLRHPPEILITTPESLNLLLNSPQARTVLGSVRSVILDEIHAIADQKRGVYLMAALERLAHMAGEFQRIALSATVDPPERMAELIGGYLNDDPSRPDHYHPRSVSLIRSSDTKHYQVMVRRPPELRERMINQSVLPPLSEEFRRISTLNHSTLFFTNTRRMCEKITWMMNEGQDREVAYSHHGSLSREIRGMVEQKLKAGELSAIVATNSLELGIDIGELDEVVLIQTPPSVTSAIQRIGRAGHSLSKISRGSIYPTHGLDYLHSAVMAEQIRQLRIEPFKPIQSPLDVLAQVILGMTAIESWDIETLFRIIRRCHSFHHLSLRHFHQVLDMLEGRYASTRIRELHPRIVIDRSTNRITAKKEVFPLLYFSGGTIPDRGYYDLWVQGSRHRIGQLDEEFVWERKIGECFRLGNQIWRITRIDSQRVEVIPDHGPIDIVPFWKAENQNQSYFMAEKIGLFLEQINSNLMNPGLAKEVEERCGMDSESALELVSFLRRQVEVTGTDLPHRHHLLIEQYQDGNRISDSRQVILHTLWGGKVNHPLALALAAAWENAYHYPLQVTADDSCIGINLPHQFSSDAIWQMIKPDDIEPLLHQKLERSGYFGARFRENAGRALLLPKPSPLKRMPFWLTRLRSKKLLEAVQAMPEFPILLETWRSCLQDEFDLEALKSLLNEIHSGRISVSSVTTPCPSPFAQALIWAQTNFYMYEGDQPISSRNSSIPIQTVRELLLNSQLRPDLPPDLIRQFTAKLHRTAAGYEPTDRLEFLELLKNRLLIPEDECPFAAQPDSPFHQLADQIRLIRLPGAAIRGYTLLEAIPRIIDAFAISPDRIRFYSIGGTTELESSKRDLKRLESWKYTSQETSSSDLNGLIGEWLQFYGPLPLERIGACWGLDMERLESLCREMAEEQRIWLDTVSRQSPAIEVCDLENLEHLLHLNKLAGRPVIRTRPAEAFVLWLADWQGLTTRPSPADRLQPILDQLLIFPASAELWESDIFPARIPDYHSRELDELIDRSQLAWVGTGKSQIAFCLPSEFELFLPLLQHGTPEPDLERLFPDSNRRMSFSRLLESSGMNSEDLNTFLWDQVWHGHLSHDHYECLRKGILNGFRSWTIPESPTGRIGIGTRRNFSRWQATRPFQGYWYRLQYPPEESDPLIGLEIAKNQVRQLLQRYGLVCRALLENEPAGMKWKSIFPALRVMELSGEIVSGYFFEGLGGIQFITPESAERFQRSWPEDAVYWLNADDPASICGLKIEGLPYSLPPRIPSTRLVYQGTRLILIIKENGAKLEFTVDPDSASIPPALSVFPILANRCFNPIRHFKVKSINSQRADHSPYASVLLEHGFQRDYQSLYLPWKP